MCCGFNPLYPKNHWFSSPFSPSGATCLSEEETHEPINSQISRDPKRLEQGGKDFLTKLAPKVIRVATVRWAGRLIELTYLGLRDCPKLDLQFENIPRVIPSKQLDKVLLSAFEKRTVGWRG